MYSIYMNHKVVGEGTYGCVTKPALKCKQTRYNRSNRLTKVMKASDAAREYKEMKSITKKPGIEKYIISMPDICEPELDSTFFNTIKQCENEKIGKALPEEFRMLVIEDGGISLRQFRDNVLQTLSKTDVAIFLTRIYHLLEGIQFFYRNNIIHHDIKDRNIVYNIETGKMRFIDFGLMQTVKGMIRDSRRNKNAMAQTWDNFPPEYDCVNRNDYRFCDYTMDYDDFLHRLAKTFDWYSFGIMFPKTLMKLRENDQISQEAFNALLKYFNVLGESNIQKRDYDTSLMPNKYKKLLEHYKLWNEGDPEPSAKSVQLQSKLIRRVDFMASDRKSLARAFQRLRECKEGYIRDKRTRRCLRKCKTGQIRNSATRRCRKVKPGSPH